MPDRDAAAPRFAATFPARFGSVIAEARGAIAGIRSTSQNGGGDLLDSDSLRCLHEIYRLRIELEIEAASVLWRTAELVCSLTDAVEVINRRRQPAPVSPAEWLPGIPSSAVGLRRGRSQIEDDHTRRGARWPDLSAPAAIDGRPAALEPPQPFGRFAERPGVHRSTRWAGLQEVDEAA